MANEKKQIQNYPQTPKPETRENGQHGNTRSKGPSGSPKREK